MWSRNGAVDSLVNGLGDMWIAQTVKLKYASCITVVSVRYFVTKHETIIALDSRESLEG